MNARVCPANAVRILVASSPGAGEVIDFMAGGAVLDIGAGGPAVVGAPTEGGMRQRHPIFTFVTGVAE